MSVRRRGRAGWRRAWGALVLLALALTTLVPAGFMPGTSLATPIVLCPDQGPMPMPAMPMAMGHHGDHVPSAPSHDAGDHPCAFAGLGAASLAVPFPEPIVPPGAAEPAAAAVPIRTLAPGRGLAAPPPPSHAPPRFRA